VSRECTDGIGYDRVGDHIAQMSERQPRGEQCGFADRAFFEQFAQVLILGRREFSHLHVVRDDQIRLDEFFAVTRVRAAGA